MRTLVSSFQDFFRTEAAGGILLLFCAVVAFAWANSPLAASYADLWGMYVTVGAGSFEISKPLLLWVNDGLMALFFFVVGLEIKREVLVGELSNPKKAALSVIAAVGGAAIPALIYVAVNAGIGSPERIAGWGVPMATDIAFALGVLALLGTRAPLALKIFLTALAIADDLMAVMVIALFYTAELKLGALALGVGLVALLAVLNKLGVRKTWPYALIGLVIWVAFLKSGVHATVAGVLVALTIPASRIIDAPAFLERAQGYLATFADKMKPGQAEPTGEQMYALHALEESVEAVETPLARLEHGLHGFVAFFVMPVFALANAGVALGAGAGALLTDAVALGIAAGLIVGKPVGVLALAWVAVRTGLASLPEGVSWRQMVGVAFLTGIGFTMSIFIANLAFTTDPALLDSAKLGILVASLVSGVVGYVLLRTSSPAAVSKA
ncbi:Na+/H+ antiporter NhaA [Rubricoccus marinus]|uniref:Na(+)/H(+) antiporter NhaA n=1 Tax=Rubricoccus marinus TaxID=716817 RepID=A0A259TVJ8_9BACT|nr:Na+/H+ antiporter NhaA [Rubricoccus marinus]OZC01568.1 Na+/H+ antiporter NhaA [Rubricoccus marinus]